MVSKANLRFCKGRRKFFDLVLLENVEIIENGTILYHNLSRGELWLVKVCPYMIHKHFFTHHNSPRDELWHKIMPFLEVPTLYYYLLTSVRS